MNKQTFTTELSRLHTNGDRLEAVRFFTITSRLGVRLSKEIIDANWSASREKCFGNNIYKLLESSADEDNGVIYDPVLKKGHSIYIKHLDTHAAAYGLHKIRQCDIKDIYGNDIRSK
jgi:hypothetical protein